MMKSLFTPRKPLAQAVAAVAIAVFWCISAVGTTVGTTVGLTSLATAINTVTSTTADAGWGIHRKDVCLRKPQCPRDRPAFCRRRNRAGTCCVVWSPCAAG
jgi:hypothetical protein